MSKPQTVPARPDPQIDLREAERIVTERLKMDEPRDPWPVVKRRILERTLAP